MTGSNREKQFMPPAFFKGSGIFLGNSGLDTISRILLIEIVLLSLAFAVFYPREPNYPVNPVKKAVGWDTLMIDGNRNRHGVAFPHLVCRGAVGEKRSDCRKCHHLSRPEDGPSSCAECHRDMLHPSTIFNHAYHKKLCGKNPSCEECHVVNKARENVKPCQDCHSDYPPPMEYIAVSYKSAMHTACAACHTKEVELSGGKDEYSGCKFCHKDIEALMMQ